MEVPSDKRIFNNLQALRGIAALLVCAFHFRYLINETWSEILFSNGQIGVQVFFMISGFIMVHTTSRIKGNYNQQALKFFVNRLIRIVPLYYLCTFIYIADDINDGYLDTHGTTLLNSLLFIFSPAGLTAGKIFSPSLEVGWSLNYEMMFYLIFTLSVFFGIHKMRFLYIWFIATVFVIPIVLIGKIPSHHTIVSDYPFSYLNIISNPILLHFLFGISLAIIVPKLKFTRISCIVLLVVAFILFLIYMMGFTGLPQNVWFDLIFCGFLVFSILINDYHTKGFQFPAFLDKFGNMSYSFYLLHPIILGYLPLLISVATFLSDLNGISLFVFAIALTIFCSWIFYETIEVKLTRMLRRIVKT